MSVHNPAKRVWRFCEPPDQGAAWVANQDIMHALIEYQSGDQSELAWRRIVVVTASWLRRHLGELGASAERRFFCLAPMLVVADGSEDELYARIDAAVQIGALDLVSIPV